MRATGNIAVGNHCEAVLLAVVDNDAAERQAEQLITLRRYIAAIQAAGR